MSYNCNGGVFKVPTISMFGGIKIAVYYNDHLPPHFHIIYNALVTRIEIETGEYIKEDASLQNK